MTGAAVSVGLFDGTADGACMSVGLSENLGELGPIYSPEEHPTIVVAFRERNFLQLRLRHIPYLKDLLRDVEELKKVPMATHGESPRSRLDSDRPANMLPKLHLDNHIPMKFVFDTTSPKLGFKFHHTHLLLGLCSSLKIGTPSATDLHPQMGVPLSSIWTGLVLHMTKVLEEATSL